MKSYVLCLHLTLRTILLPLEAFLTGWSYPWLLVSMACMIFLLSLWFLNVPRREGGGHLVPAPRSDGEHASWRGATYKLFVRRTRFSGLPADGGVCFRDSAEAKRTSRRVKMRPGRTPTGGRTGQKVF